MMKIGHESRHGRRAVRWDAARAARDARAVKVRVHKMAVCGSSTLTYSAVRIVATDADDAWCPPTLMESRFGRTLFALSIMRLASQLTRPSMSLSSCSSPGGSAGAVGADACSANAVLLDRWSTRLAKIEPERSMDERSPIPSGSKVAEEPV